MNRSLAACGRIIVASMAALLAGHAGRADGATPYPETIRVARPDRHDPSPVVGKRPSLSGCNIAGMFIGPGGRVELTARKNDATFCLPSSWWLKDGASLKQEATASNPYVRLFLRTLWDQPLQCAADSGPSDKNGQSCWLSLDTTYRIEDDGEHQGAVKAQIHAEYASVRGPLTLSPANRAALLKYAIQEATDTTRPDHAACANALDKPSEHVFANEQEVEEDVAEIVTSDDVILYDGILVSASSDTSRPMVQLSALDPVASDVRTFHDGANLGAIAYNLNAGAPQDVEILQGSALAPSATVGVISAALALIVPAAIPKSAFGFKLAANESATLQCLRSALHDAKSPVSFVAYTSRQVSKTVTGGYSYTAEVCSAKSTGAAGDPPASKACVSASTDQITSQLSFAVQARHSIVSAGIEVAENWSPRTHALSGFAYQPISQSGPDELYQLQGQTKIADMTTISALLLLYPLPCVGNGDALAFGVGPTFWRGANAEAFKQWDFRILFGLSWLHAPGVLASVGVSYHAYDAPSPGVGSVVSVARPAQPPPFATTSADEVLVSAGVALDLSLVGSAVTAIANAASMSQGAKK